MKATRGTNDMKHTKHTGTGLCAAMAAAAVLALAGCSGAAPETARTAPTPTAQIPSASGSTAASTAEATLTAAAAPVDSEPVPVPGVENDALALAASAVTAFCRPTLDYDTWIAELYPFLTQQAAIAYETVDPMNVPCTSLTGDARVRDGDGTFTIRVLVPTDAGDYSVYVHRAVETAPWGVEQITPLASE